MLHPKPIRPKVIKTGIGSLRLSYKHLKSSLASKTALRRTKLTKTRKGAPPSISKLIKACDKEFSIQVRMIGAWMKYGEWWNRDYTTGYEAPIKKLHCGHFLSRFYKAARWDFDNARPQSYMSNIHMRGDPIRFRQRLLAEIGEERVKAVEAKRDVSTKLSREFLTSTLASLKGSI